MSDAFWIAVFGFLTTAATLFAAFKAAQAKKVAQDTHTAVNSRMQELLDLTRTAAKADGKVEEKAEEKERQDG